MKRTAARTSGVTVAYRRQQLAAWLREWELDQLLQPAGPVADHPPVRGAAVELVMHRRAPAEPLQSGAIRLLVPQTPATDRRPVYVAVLRQQAPAAWWVAPFGRFGVPGLPGELATARTALHLRVLCLWNLTVLGVDVLQAAWPVGRLTQPEWRATWQVLACARDPGRPMRGALARRVGPPVVHPADPRHLYQEQEAAVWDGLVPCQTASLEYPDTGEEAAWKRAAETGDGYVDPPQ